MTGAFRAVACANIALCKYWGKSPKGDNLTAVPSLSLTLAALSTTTTVEFRAGLSADEIEIGGVRAQGRARERVIALLDEVRARAQRSERAVVVSHNDFPTASGLASSASGFSALALAAQAASGLSLSPREVSALGRRASASAARSVYPGYVELLAEAEAAEPVAPADHLDVVMLIVQTKSGEKPVSSTQGMRHTQATSAYYRAWVESSFERFERAKRALLSRDLEGLGQAMEESTLAMHASMWAARPPLNYLLPATLAVMERVRALREQGLSAFFTMDAGPHVKVLLASRDAERATEELSQVSGVLGVIRSAPGPGARLLSE